MWNPTRLTRQRVSCELRGAFASYRYDIRLVLLIRHSIDELIKLVYVQSHHVLNTCKKIVLTLVQYTSVLMKIFSLKILSTISKILLYELQIFHRLYARISAVDVQINEWTPEERGPNRTTYNKVAFLSFFHYLTHTHTHTNSSKTTSAHHVELTYAWLQATNSMCHVVVLRDLSVRTF